MDNFFEKRFDHEYCSETLCDVYVPHRWIKEGGTISPLQMLDCDLGDIEAPLYNPKLIIEILLLHPAWREGWEIIKDDFIHWLKDSDEIPQDLKELDLNSLRGRKALVRRMNSMLLFSCSTMRKKIVEIIKKSIRSFKQ